MSHRTPRQDLPPSFRLAKPPAVDLAAPGPPAGAPEWEDLVEALPVPVGFWSIGDDRQGAFVDWPGCALVVEVTDGELVVRGHVGSGGDHCPDIDVDLDDVVSADLGDLHLDYQEPHEQLWLTAPEGAPLAEACARVAALVPVLAGELERRIELDPGVWTLDGLEQRGPW
ncbi:unannotated protein [freshwater metagenome]|uniref:Unannotated protein n=1 Tax=freshwater metagenome TaxID=449393 RepID=A0A6J7FK72_9ZZZZ|nr:hypothetical protein [Actinomycetota bacterium]